MRDAGVHVTPTMVLRMHDSTMLSRVPRALQTPANTQHCTSAVGDWGKQPDSLRQRYYRTVFDVVGAMFRAGIPIMAGSDGPQGCLVPGWSLHEELRNLVRAGLSPRQALAAATITPARFMGLADSLGTVHVGKVADLVLLDADPTIDIANVSRVRGVVADGRWNDRRTLDAMQWGARDSPRRP
jgi:predicted amidohydrolase YtcJ